MPDLDALRDAYDDQLRDDAETPSAVAVAPLGPLRLVTFDGGRGFVTYRRLDAVPAGGFDALVTGALDHFRADPVIDRVEWKTRGHDHAPGLHEALLAHDFVPEDPESVMIGEVRLLAADVTLPDGVTLRRVTEHDDVLAMCAMQDEVFGFEPNAAYAEAIWRRLGRRDGMELWVAEADGVIVSAGRLEPVAGTDFVGIWGGATRPEWRGRGIYRALTSERARSALAQGRTYVHSDSTEFSRPILERAGLVKVTTTTPYQWQRDA